MTRGRKVPHCPKCGAPKSQWKHGLLHPGPQANWDDGDPSEANPADGCRCPHCGIAVVGYARFERDPDDGGVSLYEYVPKHCMQCGKEIGEDHA